MKNYCWCQPEFSILPFGYPSLHLSPDGVQLGSLVSGSTAPDVEEFSCDIPNGGKLHIIIINVHLKSKQLLRCQGSIKCQQTLDNQYQYQIHIIILEKYSCKVN